MSYEDRESQCVHSVWFLGTTTEAREVETALSTRTAVLEMLALERYISYLPRVLMHRPDAYAEDPFYKACEQLVALEAKVRALVEKELEKRGLL